MQSATQSPQPERLYDRLEACASNLAEAALEQAMLSLTVVTRDAAAGAQVCFSAEPARADVIPSGPAAGGLALVPADLALNHGGHSSAAEPEALGLAEAELAGLTHGTEQLWDSAPLAREAAAEASPGLCTPRSSRAGVLEDHESSCELGRASSGSGAGSPALTPAPCRSSGGQRSCNGAAWRAAALDCAQPSNDSRSSLSPDPDPDPGPMSGSPRSDGCPAVRGSAAWQLSPDRDPRPERRRCMDRIGNLNLTLDAPPVLPAAPNDRDPRPERRRWLSRSACELGDASSSAGEGLGLGTSNLNLDAAAALPAAPNGPRDSDKENVAAVAIACGLDGSRGETGFSADGGGLGREGALLASEFAGLGLFTGVSAAPGGGGAPAGASSSGTWGALRQSSSATLTDPGSQPPVRGALSEDTALGSSQARQAAAAGPGEYCFRVALGNGESCMEAEDGVQSRSDATSPAAGRGKSPGAAAVNAGAAAASKRAALQACGEQQTASSGAVTAHGTRSAGESREGSPCEHGLHLPRVLHNRNAVPAMRSARSDSPGAGAAAAAPERSACEAHAHPAGEEALPRSQTLQTLPDSGARTEAGAARSDCGSANGDLNSGSRVSGSRVVRDGAVPVLSSSSGLVPLGPGGSGGGGDLPHAADEPGEVQSAPEAGSRGRGGAPAAKRSLNGAWRVLPDELVLRSGALCPGPRPFQA